MTAVLDFFWAFFGIFLVLESLNMKMTVLGDYLELAKTVEIWCRSRNNFLFWGIQNLKFHVSNVEIHGSIVNNPITTIIRHGRAR